MPIPYPAIAADSRRLIVAGYQVSRPQFKGGGVMNPRLRGSKPSDAKLTLEYQILNQAKTLEILGAWDDSLSGYFELELPAEVACGITSTNLAERIVSASSQGWRFAERPKIEDLPAMLHNVSVRLEGGFYTAGP